MATRKEIAWKKGDFALHEFELVKIVSVRKGRIKEIQQIAVTSSAPGSDFNGRVVPLTMENYSLSRYFEKQYDRMRAQNRINANLNLSEIHSWLVDKWLESCNVAYGEKSYAICAEALDFVDSAVDGLIDASGTTIGGTGVRLFR